MLALIDDPPTHPTSYVRNTCPFLFRRATKTPHILLLDEPTNHLDIETIDSLADAIKRFEGGVVLVSHDMRLIDQVAKEIWECDKGTITRVQGDIAAYKRMLQKKLEAAADRFERDRRSGGSAGGGLSESAPAPALSQPAKAKGRAAGPVAPPPAPAQVAPPTAPPAPSATEPAAAASNSSPFAPSAASAAASTLAAAPAPGAPQVDALAGIKFSSGPLRLAGVSGAGGWRERQAAKEAAAKEAARVAASGNGPASDGSAW